MDKMRFTNLPCSQYSVLESSGFSVGGRLKAFFFCIPFSEASSEIIIIIRIQKGFCETFHSVAFSIVCFHLQFSMEQNMIIRNLKQFNGCIRKYFVSGTKRQTFSTSVRCKREEYPSLYLPIVCQLLGFFFFFFFFVFYFYSSILYATAVVIIYND